MNATENCRRHHNDSAKHRILRIADPRDVAEKRNKTPMSSSRRVFDPRDNTAVRKHTTSKLLRTTTKQYRTEKYNQTSDKRKQYCDVPVKTTTITFSEYVIVHRY
ncbi:uncharacterized protein LOC144431918 [Styela clava]